MAEEINQQQNTNPDSNVENTDSQVVSKVKSKSGQEVDFPEFEESNKKGFFMDEKLEYLKDLNVNVYIELGRTKMQIKDILELERGYVIELDKMASEPVDVYVNNKKIAEGEVVVIDKHFGIRITNLVEPKERLKG
ncbi:MAG: hypothetical protein STSR0008_16150 [Ignavibacterium sp.]